MKTAFSIFLFFCLIIPVQAEEDLPSEIILSKINFEGKLNSRGTAVKYFTHIKGEGEWLYVPYPDLMDDPDLYTDYEFSVVENVQFKVDNQTIKCTRQTYCDKAESFDKTTQCPKKLKQRIAWVKKAQGRHSCDPYNYSLFGGVITKTVKVDTVSIK